MQATLLVICLGTLVSGIKYFSFERSLAPGSPSAAILTSSPSAELPPTFVLCTSHKEENLEGNGFIQLYGQDQQAWFSLALKEQEGTGNVNLWAFLGAGRQMKSYILGRILHVRPRSWYHICTRLDTLNGTLTLAVNGKVVTSETDPKKENLLSNKPEILSNRLVLGISLDMTSSTEVQMQGSVSNVQVFTEAAGQDLAALTSGPCAAVGDYLDWENMEWNITGDSVTEGESLYDVCHGHEDEYTLLAVPLEMKQKEGIQLCRKLRGSHYEVLESSVRGGQKFTLSNYTTWFNETTQGSCENIWTPFSDEMKEGVFVNLEDKTLAEFLPWGQGQPNGGTLENSVAILPSINSYIDFSSESRACPWCKLKVDLILTLRGLCKETSMGNIFFNHKKYKFYFSDYYYSILNTEQGVGFDGWRSTTIR